MNIYDFLFIFTFLGLMGINIYKIYALMTIGEKMKLGESYNLKLGFILFMCFLMCWFITLSIFMINPERTIYMILFRLSNLFLAFQAIFLFIEIIISLSARASEMQKQPYFSNQKQ